MACREHIEGVRLRTLRDALEGAFEARLRVSIAGSRPTSTGHGSLTNRCQPVGSGPVDNLTLLNM